MRKFFFGMSFAIVLAAGSAAAADLPRAMRKAPAVVPTAGMWSGFYAGLSGGYAGGSWDYTYTGIDTTAVPPGTSGDFSVTSSGGFLGGQLGYNWKVAPNWLAGVETDIFWADIDGKLTLNSPTAGFAGAAGSKVNWFGTTRGRIGWLPFDRLLLYGTGGVAYGEVESNYSLTALNLVASLPLSGHTSDTRVGWTAGAGAEARITDRLSLKAEYLYVDLGTLTALSVAATNGDSMAVKLPVRFQTLKAGFNYRF